jgi:hypothetical protein
MTSFFIVGGGGSIVDNVVAPNDTVGLCLAFCCLFANISKLDNIREQ